MIRMTEKEMWDLEVSSDQRWFSFDFSEVWRYRDLLVLFVKRDVITTYKQTILGPLWFFLQPLITTTVFIFTFGRIKDLKVEGPPVLFYMGGVVLWQYFSGSLTSTSNTFVNNAAIFGKVYFPRIILPVSTVLANLVKFSMQFVLYLLVVVYYFFTMPEVHVTAFVLLIPYLIFLMVITCLGIGMLVSALSVKYRDFQYLMVFAVQLLMFASPVIYPLTSLPEKLQRLLAFNPMVAVIDGVRYGVTGLGHFSWWSLSAGSATGIIVFLIGAVFYNRTEKSFVDTV